MLGLGVASPKDIDLEAIAWTTGAVVHYRPLEKCEARIVAGAKRAVISVNAHAIPTRRRFSLAHELGHWHFHKGQTLYCTQGDIGDPVKSGALDPERQADDFASDLILPNYLFRPMALSLKKPSLQAVREIADTFRASLTATYMKLVASDIFPLLLVCHNREHRRWFRRAPSVAGWWFPRDDLDPDSFAFDLFFKAVSESAFPRKIGAGAWFTFKNCDRYEIQEQSFRLPNNEVLTILLLPNET